VPTGGTAGQLLSKTSGTDFATTWVAPPTSVTGNAGTATALQTARTIDGVSFDAYGQHHGARAGHTRGGEQGHAG
jgi:hypothetical protein